MSSSFRIIKGRSRLLTSLRLQAADASKNHMPSLTIIGYRELPGYRVVGDQSPGQSFPDDLCRVLSGPEHEEQVDQAPHARGPMDGVEPAGGRGGLAGADHGLS